MDSSSAASGASSLLQGNIEPLSLLMLLLVQVGGRFLKFELTKAQEKLIQNSIVQAIILFAIIFITTRNFITSVLLVALVNIFMHVLFNENSRYNILSKKWLKNEKLLKDDKLTSLKDIYYRNIHNVLMS
jgi:predicted membrane protein